ncbi:MAG: STAS domain-containing protein [Desulfobacterales bacterium]|jgi:anti-anti-sigma factor
MRQYFNHIITEQFGAVTLFEIQGDITHHSEPFFSDAFRNGNHQKHPRILLKIDKEAYINSGGISVLIQFLAKSQQNSQLVGITGVSDHFKKIFKMVGITKFAHLYDSVENAVEALSDKSCSSAAAC